MRRLLIDECINTRLAGRLRDVLPECSVDTVKDLGWSGQKDHVLVPNIQGRFDVFLTIDKGFEYEHDLKKLSFGIVIVETVNNEMPSYERVVQELVRQIQRATPGQVTHVTDPER
jgi:predicted nuclease of predicted toxin-antitoxin system